MNYSGLAFLNILFMCAIVALFILSVTARVKYMKFTDAKHLKRNAVVVGLSFVLAICAVMLVVLTTDFAYKIVLMNSYTMEMTLLIMLQFVATVFGVSQLKVTDYVSEQDRHVNTIRAITNKEGNSSINP